MRVAGSLYDAAMATVRSATRRIWEGVSVARDLPGLSRRERVRAAVVGIVLPFTAYLGSSRAFRVPVRLPDGSSADFYANHPSDLIVLGEVFAWGQYDLPDVVDPKVIIDAGAHIGASAAYFATRYPGCRVIALEPSRSTFSRLRRHTSHLSNVESLNVALGGESGSVTFYERSASWGSSLTQGDDARAIEAEMVSLEDAMARLGVDEVDLLKLDVEGAEFAVLSSPAVAPERVRAVIGELHSWMPNREFTDDEFFGLLRAYHVTEDVSGTDRVFRAVSRGSAS